MPIKFTLCQDFEHQGTKYTIDGYKVYVHCVRNGQHYKRSLGLYANALRSNEILSLFYNMPFKNNRPVFNEES